MSTVEVKYALRKIEFPECAREAVKRIESLINGRSPTIKQMDLAIDLMSEFVFWEKDRRGNKRSSELSCIQEMQLLEVLCDYFAQMGTETVKNTVFLSLFGPSTIHIRSKVLCKLVSIGVSSSCAALLAAAGAWMQQLGCTSASSLLLARSLVKDYFALIPDVLPSLQLLPQLAPQFTANFLTAIAEIYLTDKYTVFTPPPDSLLETITQWVTENPTLCLAAQHSPAALPTGSIAMPVTTPIAGLFKWCILAPLSNPNSFKSTSKHKRSPAEISQIYSKLHLALLESLLEAKTDSSLPSSVCAQHITGILPTLQTQITDLQRVGKDANVEQNINVSLDRLAQAIQVSFATRCIYGKLQELIVQLENLPKNRLLTIVTNTHKQCVL